MLPHLLYAAAFALQPAADVPDFRVRPGYTVELAADVGGETRFVEPGEPGVLYLSQPRAGKVLTLTDPDGDGVYDKQIAFVEGYDTAHGLHYVDGWLWFTQSGAVHKARDEDGDGVADEVVTVIPQGELPEGGGHWWRSICVAEDGFYTSIGDSGNINDERDTPRQKVWKYDLDGTNGRVWSSGIRNTEKLRQRPGTEGVWGADHGSDWYGKPLGEDKDRQPVTNLIPPEEFNHYVEGGFYGHPFVVGNKLPRIEFQDRDDIIELAEATIPPAYEGGAHWANNGWTFYYPPRGTSDPFAGHADGPAEGDAFIAYHGSWNRNPPAGYRVQRVTFDRVSNRPNGGYPIVETHPGDERLGRPCDVTVDHDGSILFTDSMNSAIYRIRPADDGGEAVSRGE